MLIYPQFIDPVALTIGPVKIYWYGLCYFFSFVLGWGLAIYRVKKNSSYHNSWSVTELNDLLFYLILGVIIGGRLGYVLFYGFNYYIHHPLDILKTWQGGMSFHGGFLGVLIACLLFSVNNKNNNKKSFFEITDFIAPFIPIGLAAGRVGNFINGELWGRVTHLNLPWRMIYPRVNLQPRHPSELYEFFLEGILLFIILFFYSHKPREKTVISALFLILYGSFRFFCEFFRQPDGQLGFVLFHWMTRGQELSIPMVVLGLFLLIRLYLKNKKI